MGEKQRGTAGCFQRVMCSKKCGILLLVIIFFVWLGVYYPAECIGWVCFALWVFAEFSALPAVSAADKRCYLMPGENSLPWVQSLTLGLARGNYIFAIPDGVPVSLGLGTLIAIACAGYTALVALRLGKGELGKRLSSWVWIGVMVPNLIRWLLPIDVAGYWYVGVILLNKSSLWAGIIRAVKTRDGRYFCDLTMVLFNTVSTTVWFGYAIYLKDGYILMNQIIGIIFLLPCIILKVLLHPRFFGKTAAELDTDQRPNVDLAALQLLSPTSEPTPASFSTFPVKLDALSEESELGGFGTLDDPESESTLNHNEPFVEIASFSHSPGFGSVPLPSSLRQRSTSQRSVTLDENGVCAYPLPLSLDGDFDGNVCETSFDVSAFGPRTEVTNVQGAYANPAAAIGTLASALGRVVTAAIVDTFEQNFEGLGTLNADGGFGGPQTMLEATDIARSESAALIRAASAAALSRASSALDPLGDQDIDVESGVAGSEHQVSPADFPEDSGLLRAPSDGSEGDSEISSRMSLIHRVQQPSLVSTTSLDSDAIELLLLNSSALQSSLTEKGLPTQELSFGTLRAPSDVTPLSSGTPSSSLSLDQGNGFGPSNVVDSSQGHIGGFQPPDGNSAPEVPEISSQGVSFNEPPTYP